MGEGKRFSAHVRAGDDPGPVIVAALQVAEEFSREERLSERQDVRLMVVVEELVANVVRHGRAGCDLDLLLTLAVAHTGVLLELEDDGAAFDPTAAREFDGPDRLTGGGVGLAVVREWASEMTYVREGGRNRLRLILA